MQSHGAFWSNNATEMVVDWLSNADNYKRLMNKHPVSGGRVVDLQDEIASLINQKYDIGITRTQVKSKITYIRRLYREAVAMNSTGKGGDILERQEAKCPPFQRLHASFSSSLALHHPQIRLTGGPPARSAIDLLTPDVEVEDVIALGMAFFFYCV